MSGEQGDLFDTPAPAPEAPGTSASLVPSPERVLPDAEARRRIREDLDSTFFVEAAAGTGKTSALVSRIVALLRTGAGSLDRIVALTFTEKAAGEMKLRLREEIEKTRADPALPGAERARLEAALSELELARIGTIHAFCGDLLHERPVEAGVDPLFEVMPEDEAQRILDRAFERWFQESLADPPEGLRRVLHRRARGFDAQGPREQLRAAVDRLVEHRDFDAPWRREEFDRRGEIDRVMKTLAELAPLAERATRKDDWLARNVAVVARFVDENVLREAVRGRDYDALEAALRDLARTRRNGWHWTGGRAQHYGVDLTRSQVRERRDAAKAQIDALLEASDADLAALLHAELRPVVAGYEAAKERAGVLDFLDLLVRARDLVVADPGVRAELQNRFGHFFVDEFQDTDPLQAEILLLLAADSPEAADWREVTPVPGKLFLVGDPKQSIYRFRRADVAIYEATKRALAARGAEVLHLTTSFRGLPAIQQAVNAAFAPLMRGGDAGSQAEYVALEPFRPAVEDRPALVALPTPRPYGDYGRIVKWRIEDSFPDAAGAFVRWLVTESEAHGWRVQDRDSGELVPIAARHVCLLFRRFKTFGRDVTRPYVRALEARGVPHVLVGGRSFHEREEVLAVRNALCAIEWPDDELRVFATLRGPLFALGDDALLAYRARFGRLHPLRRFDDEALAALDAPEREVFEALTVLRRLHAGRNRRPIAETLSRLLEAVRAHAGIAIWPTGEQALANVLRTIDLARRFERRGAPSFRAFAERLEAEAERGEAEDAPVVEEGTEGVRIMTVHRAKGLEFPVVILADPTANAVGRNPSRHVDPERRLWAEPLCGCSPHDLLDAADEELRRDGEESVRLAYVAATRARDLLVVPGVGDGVPSEGEGWLDALNPIAYPPRTARRKSAPAPGCPEFGEDSVYERPPGAENGLGGAVKPGLHAPAAGEHGVVWWDPRALRLDVQEEVGLRQQRVLEADEEGRGEESERAHARWQTARSETLAKGGAPSLVVKTVTELAAEAAELPEAGAGAGDEGEAIRSEEVEFERAGRPGGTRFGTLVHAVLAAVDLAADEDAVRACAHMQGRLLGAAEDEVAAAAIAVQAALAHPLLRRAAACAEAGGLRRETPMLLTLADGTLAEGVVDLAFREDRGGTPTWTVVDFKTDRELGIRRAAYEAQVGLYVAAVRSATGEPAEGVLLSV